MSASVGFASRWVLGRAWGSGGARRCPLGARRCPLGARRSALVPLRRCFPLGARRSALVPLRPASPLGAGRSALVPPRRCFPLGAKRSALVPPRRCFPLGARRSALLPLGAVSPSALSARRWFPPWAFAPSLTDTESSQGEIQLAALDGCECVTCVNLASTVASSLVNYLGRGAGARRSALVPLRRSAFAPLLLPLLTQPDSPVSRRPYQWRQNASARARRSK